MNQLILFCIIALVSFIHAENTWKNGPCVYKNGNCGLGTRIQTCINCKDTPTTREVDCLSLCPGKLEAIENKQQETLEPEDAEFYSWSPWSECTSSCGLGEQIQSRGCKAGPGNCTGDATRTQSCTPLGECVFQSCDDVPTGDSDENFEQCDTNSRRCGNWRMMNVEWKIGSGKTKTKGTGPNYDNTFKKECGKYVYFDPRSTSSNYKELRMISPVTTTATSCLSFSLSMFSTRASAMGHLIVKILGSKDTLYNRDGGVASRRQGWEPVKINVPKGSNFIIVFAANAKGHWQSDIAIDDIMFTENEKCEKGVDGNWAEWGDWSDCEPSCGSGEKTRMRTCTSPSPTNDGLRCIGHSEETELCKNLKLCPVNGKWGRWGSYSTCQQTCGDEYQIRTRGCEDRVGDGVECLDDDGNNAMSEYQSRKCKLPQCITDVKCPAGDLANSNSQCPDGWIEFRVDRGTDSELNCYKFSDTMVTYNQAKTACNNVEPTKAYLTSILTAEEQVFLLEQANEDFFNGARGTSRSGASRWTDGKAFLYSNVPRGQDLDCSYTDINTGEWNTHECGSADHKHYVCKMQADLWNPWSAFSKCSGSCAGAEGIKVRSRTCVFPREGFPFECIPIDPQNIDKKDGITSEFEILPCTAATPVCPTQTTTTTTTTPAPVYSWLEWSAEIEVGSLINIEVGSLVKIRACDGARDGVACEDEGANMLYSDDKHVQLQIVSADCGEGWEKMISSTGETTCWHHSVNQSLIYEEAKSYCTDMGGIIANIISYEEQSFVMEMLPTIDNSGNFPTECNNPDMCSYWIGANEDSSSRLKWSWENSTRMGYSYFDESFNHTIIEEYDGLVLDIDKIYKWFNYPINETKQALCKKYIFQRRECPEYWYRIGDECFKEYVDYTYFEPAISICESYNATLASVTNLDVQVFIKNVVELNSGTFEYFYIGGKFVTTGAPDDNEDNVTAVWVDGTYWTPFTYFSGVPNGEIPDSAQPGECIRTNGIEWFNDNCTEGSTDYICKVSLVPEPECSEGWERLNTPNGIQCYYVGAAYATGSPTTYYADAKADCESRGAHLAKLDQAYERSFALHIVEKSSLATGYDYSIGLIAEADNALKWTDGQPEDYNHFFTTAVSTPGCGYIKEDSTGFEFSDCTSNRHFICQRFPMQKNLVGPVLWDDNISLWKTTYVALHRKRVLSKNVDVKAQGLLSDMNFETKNNLTLIKAPAHAAMYPTVDIML